MTTNDGALLCIFINIIMLQYNAIVGYAQLCTYYILVFYFVSLQACYLLVRFSINNVSLCVDLRHDLDMCNIMTLCIASSLSMYCKLSGDSSCHEVT